MNDGYRWFTEIWTQVSSWKPLMIEPTFSSEDFCSVRNDFLTRGYWCALVKKMRHRYLETFGLFSEVTHTRCPCARIMNTSMWARSRELSKHDKTGELDAHNLGLPTLGLGELDTYGRACLESLALIIGRARHTQGELAQCLGLSLIRPALLRPLLLANNHWAELGGPLTPRRPSELG